jgi:hypothetical protein
VHALEAQVKALEREAELLKITSYDRARAVIEDQLRLFALEREQYERRVQDLEATGIAAEAELDDVRRELARRERIAQADDLGNQIAALRARIREYFAAVLLPEARLRAEREHDVDMPDRERAILESALQMSARRAAELGLEEEWARWAADEGLAG